MTKILPYVLRRFFRTCVDFYDISRRFGVVLVKLILHLRKTEHLFDFDSYQPGTARHVLRRFGADYFGVDRVGLDAVPRPKA